MDYHCSIQMIRHAKTLWLAVSSQPLLLVIFICTLYWKKRRNIYIISKKWVSLHNVIDIDKKIDEENVSKDKFSKWFIQGSHIYITYHVLAQRHSSTSNLRIDSVEMATAASNIPADLWAFFPRRPFRSWCWAGVVDTQDWICLTCVCRPTVMAHGSDWICERIMAYD